VLVQTYNPDHYAILAARDHDYDALYQIERPLREGLGLPPFGFLVLLLVSHPKQDQAQEQAERLARLLLESGAPPLAFEGPAPAPLARLRGRYRWQLLAKGPEPESVHRWVRDAVERLAPSDQRGVEVDVDPVDLC
jgi:primosomal protein N' (replication factor Y)